MERFLFGIFCSIKKSWKKCIIKGKSIFEYFGKTVLSMAIVAFVFSVIALIMVFEGKSALGTNMVLSLIPFLYVGIMDMVIIILYKIIINKRTWVFTSHRLCYFLIIS
jgi:hypothetical protein